MGKCNSKETDNINDHTAKEASAENLNSLKIELDNPSPEDSNKHSLNQAKIIHDSRENDATEESTYTSSECLKKSQDIIPPNDGVYNLEI